MAMHVKSLELGQNQFPFGVNNSCKLDRSAGVQSNQAYFMKEVYFSQVSFMIYPSYINYLRSNQYTKISKYSLDQIQVSKQQSNLNIKIVSLSQLR
jgi:hypothetical protein